MLSRRSGFASSSLLGSLLVLAACGSELDLGTHAAGPPLGACADTTCAGAPDGGAPGPGGDDGGIPGLVPGGVLPAGGPWAEASAGLEGGDIRALAFDAASAAVYAATWGTGVFRSLDGGATWAASNGGLGDRMCVTSVVAHPGRPDVVFAQASRCDRRGPFLDFGTGLLRSSDRGATWTPIATNLAAASLASPARLAPAKSAPDTVYFASSVGVHRSLDGGATFAFRSKPPASAPNAYPQAIVVDPKNADVVYAVTTDRKLWRSTDAAVTWTLLTSSADGVALSPADPLSLLVASSSSPYLSSSSDGGQNLVPTSAATPMGILWAPSSPSRVYGVTSSPSGHAFHVSDDAGKAFRALPTSVPLTRHTLLTTGFRTWEVDPKDADHFLVSAAGVLATKDGGATLGESSRGMINRDVQGLALAPSAPNVLYAASLDAVFVSKDAGASWTRSPFVFSASGDVTAVAVHPTDPKTVYVAATGYAAQQDTHLFKSIDGGQSFQDVGVEVGNGSLGFFQNVRKLVVDPQVPSTVYAFGRGRVMISRNDGIGWSPAPLPPCASDGDWAEVALDPSDSSRLLATTNGTVSCVVRSTDRGASFTKLTAGLTVFGHDLFDQRMAGVVYDRKQPNTLYACTDAGLHRSTNGGVSWSPAMVGLPADTACHGVFVTAGEGHVAVLANDQELATRFLFVSTDGATSWKQAKGIDTTGDFQEAITSVVVHPSDPKTVYLGLRSSVGVAVTKTLGL